MIKIRKENIYTYGVIWCKIHTKLLVWILLVSCICSFFFFSPRKSYLTPFCPLPNEMQKREQPLLVKVSLDSSSELPW